MKYKPLNNGEHKMNALLDQVKQHCEDNYHKGFNVFVDLYSDADLLEEIGAATTLDSAIEKLKAFISLRAEIATARAIKKYGKETCLKAFDRHINYGEGANTIGFELNPRLTTRQADAAINAGREILRSGI